MRARTLIDLHNLSAVSSGCSVLQPDELFEAARRRGLDVVGVTDHCAIEGANVTQRLGRGKGFPVVRGVEARTDLGDMLVFGYYRDAPEGISLQDLCWYVHEVRGYSTLRLGGRDRAEAHCVTSTMPLAL